MEFAFTPQNPLVLVYLLIFHFKCFMIFGVNIDAPHRNELSKIMYSITWFISTSCKCRSITYRMMPKMNVPTVKIPIYPFKAGSSQHGTTANM